MTKLFERIRRPEYIGENRCPPCTAVNVVLAVLLGAVAGLVFAPLGAIVLLVGLASIYFRGYLVPGTPELTKRYFPDWLLARFDKLPEGRGVVSPAEARMNGAGADGAGTDGAGTNDEGEAAGADESSSGADRAVDPESLLVGAGAVEECEDVDDLCLTDSFAEAVREAAFRLRDDADARREAVATVFDVDPDAVELTVEEEEPPVAEADGRRLFSWVSEGALVADLAAAESLETRLDGWSEVPPPQRAGILQALRSFLEVCPLCEGRVEMSEETVKSCCRSWEVIAVRCEDCDARFLEIDPEGLEGVEVSG